MAGTVTIQSGASSIFSAYDTLYALSNYSNEFKSFFNVWDEYKLKEVSIDL
jgi:hypothetical protein